MQPFGVELIQKARKILESNCLSMHITQVSSSYDAAKIAVELVREGPQGEGDQYYSSKQCHTLIAFTSGRCIMIENAPRLISYPIAVIMVPFHASVVLADIHQPVIFFFML